MLQFDVYTLAGYYIHTLAKHNVFTTSSLSSKHNKLSYTHWNTFNPIFQTCTYSVFFITVWRNGKSLVKLDNPCPLQYCNTNDTIPTHPNSKVNNNNRSTV